MPDYYYLESDGQIFLLKDGNRWRFPKNKRELPAKIEPVFTMHLPGGSVVYAKPMLDHHPTEWFHKDEVIGRRDVDPLVQQAVNRSLVRGAAKALIVEEGKVLMVLAARGITKGYWNLPGGFISYTEHPEISARREVEEELGLKIKIEGLVGIYSETFPRTGGYMICFAYRAKRLTNTVRPHPEEIESVRWVPLNEARRITRNPFSKAALRDYSRKKPARV